MRRNSKHVNNLLMVDPLPCPGVVHAHIAADNLHQVLVGSGDTHRLPISRGAMGVASDEVIRFEPLYSRVWDVHGLHSSDTERDLISGVVFRFCSLVCSSTFSICVPVPALCAAWVSCAPCTAEKVPCETTFPHRVQRRQTWGSLPKLES